jgi:hypothetical protein
VRGRPTLDLREQYPDGRADKCYQKMDSTEKLLVQGNGWYKSWVGTKIMLVQTHRWYKETISTKKLLVPLNYCYK